MLRIVFQNLGCGNRLKNLVQRNVLLCHLLLRVLGDTDVLCRSLSADSLQYRQVVLVPFKAHGGSSVPQNARRDKGKAKPPTGRVGGLVELPVPDRLDDQLRITTGR